jgi:hypothetical protein
MVFVGGILVLFIYVTRLASNEIFSLSTKIIIITAIFIPRIMTIEKLNSSLPFFTYLCFSDPLFLIIRLNYLRDNSVIFFESSYQQKGLRPRCWIKMNFILPPSQYTLVSQELASPYNYSLLKVINIVILEAFMAAEGSASGPCSVGLEDAGTFLEESMGMFHPVPDGAIRLLKFFGDRCKYPLLAIVPGRKLSVRAEFRMRGSRNTAGGRLISQRYRSIHIALSPTWAARRFLWSATTFSQQGYLSS